MTRFGQLIVRTQGPSIRLPRFGGSTTTVAEAGDSPRANRRRGRGFCARNRNLVPNLVAAIDRYRLIQINSSVVAAVWGVELAIGAMSV